jgi:hypothetical protein
MATRIGISGHQGIPEVGLAWITEKLGAYLAAAAPPVVGVSSLAAGADQLFATAVLDAGGTLEAVIPCEGYEATFGDDADLERYRELLAAAVSVETLPFPSPTEEAFYAGGKRVLELADQLVAIWDGLPARGLGGTADIVALAEERGVPATVIWPEGLRR